MKPRPILYTEDDDNDVYLMMRACRLLGIPNPLEVRGDVTSAMDYLRRSIAWPEADKPCLLLLDLSMPGRHGLELLQWLRNQPDHVNLAVVVLTSSNQKQDIHRAFLLGANGFIIKPGDPQMLLRIMRVIQGYWLGETRPPGSFVDFAAAADVPVLDGLYGKGSPALAGPN